MGDLDGLAIALLSGVSIFRQKKEFPPEPVELGFVDPLTGVVGVAECMDDAVQPLLDASLDEQRLGQRGKAEGGVYRDAAAQSGVEVPAFTIDTLMHKLGHNHVDLLKMDIEGAEYEVLEALIASSSRPRQLLVEFHHRFPSIAKSMTSDIIGGLRRIGYRIFAVSGTGREVSFIYRPTVVPAIGSENLCVANEKD